MTTSNKLYASALVIAAIAVGSVLFAASAKAELNSAKCTTTNVTAATVGNQASSVIAATSTGSRAFAMIQQVRDATGTATSSVTVSFANGYNATLNNGIQLSTTTPSIVFGLNTDFPYDGAVTGITSVGSTTVRFTECVY